VVPTFAEFCTIYRVFFWLLYSFSLIDLKT
jgi:hypothetical protein